MWDDNCVGYAKMCPMVKIFTVATPTGDLCGSNQPGCVVSSVYFLSFINWSKLHFKMLAF